MTKPPKIKGNRLGWQYKLTKMDKCQFGETCRMKNPEHLRKYHQFCKCPGGTEDISWTLDTCTQCGLNPVRGNGKVKPDEHVNDNGKVKPDEHVKGKRSVLKNAAKTLFRR